LATIVAVKVKGEGQEPVKFVGSTTAVALVTANGTGAVATVAELTGVVDEVLTVPAGAVAAGVVAAGGVLTAAQPGMRTSNNNNDRERIANLFNECTSTNILPVISTRP
jgi:hypothetical protein